jgi:hypothetical protein
MYGILQWHFDGTEFYENGLETTVFVPTWETEKNKRAHRFRKFLFVHNPEKEAWYKVHKIKA